MIDRRIEPHRWQGARARVLVTALIAVAVVVVLLIASPSRVAYRPAACIYPGSSHADLSRVERQIGHQVNCVLEYNMNAPTWAKWADPWFVTNTEPNINWTRFVRSGHQMILTISMFPTQVDGTNWRAAGASGAYVRYARELARNLVAAGMGHTVIRLGHEANGVSYPDNVGTTPVQETEWRQFWRRTAIAMRSVPGAHFDFNWCIENGPRPIPFAAYYPGNDVVDSIGDDVYDSGLPKNVSYADRWQYVDDEPGGVRAIAAFARAHDKPLTIPEWGLVPSSQDGGGADPAFTRGFLAFLRADHVRSQAYFFTEGFSSTLLGDPASLAIYRNQILG